MSWSGVTWRLPVNGSDTFVEITPMTEADMDGKAFVHYTSMQETYPGIFGDDYLAGQTLEKCRAVARKWPDGVLVAKVNGQVVGFAGYGAARDPALQDCGELFALYVLKAYHGSQVGYALTCAVTNALRQYKRIAVQVAQGNDRAIRFYQRFGFRFDGTSEIWQLGKPVPVLRMIYERG